MILINIEGSYMEKIAKMDLPLEIKSKQAKVNHILKLGIEVQQTTEKKSK